MLVASLPTLSRRSGMVSGSSSVTTTSAGRISTVRLKRWRVLGLPVMASFWMIDLVRLALKRPTVRTKTRSRSCLKTDIRCGRRMHRSPSTTKTPPLPSALTSAVILESSCTRWLTTTDPSVSPVSLAIGPSAAKILSTPPLARLATTCRPPVGSRSRPVQLTTMPAPGIHRVAGSRRVWLIGSGRFG